MNSIGNMIKKERIRQNMTQIEISEKSGIKRPHIARFESSGNGTITTLMRLADALGCEIILAEKHK